MPPKKARPRPITWKVTGGAHSGGLIVRGGSETTSPELTERLATKSVILELELQGERMRYKLVRGSGPQTGWIGTKFKGKDLLQKRPLKAWILATGTRGDIQPYLALAVYMQQVGYEMDIWTCEDYRSFVEEYGIRMHSIAGSCEELIKSTQGMNQNKKPKDGKSQQSAEKEEKDEKEREANTIYQRTQARWWLSLNFKGKPVSGIEATKMLPKDIEEKLPLEHLAGMYASNAGALSYTGYTELAEKYVKEAERLGKLREEEQERQEREKKEASANGTAAPSSEAAEKKPEEGKEGAAEGAEKEVTGTGDPDEPDWDWITKETAANPSTALAKIMSCTDFEQYAEESYNAVKAYFISKRAWLKYAEECRVDVGLPMDLVFALGIQGMFLKDLAAEDKFLNGLSAEMKKNPPDIVFHNLFWNVVAAQVEAILKIPAVTLDLQPHGIFFGDPHAPWIEQDPRIWPLVQQHNPYLYNFATLEEAKASGYKVEDKPSLVEWAKMVMMEEVLLEPVLGVHPLRDMGPVEFHRRGNENHMVGFLSSIASDRFMSFMGEFSQRQVAKHTYTGFWIMNEKDQTGEKASAMFGGKELMKQIEDFIAAGDKPAYIGWGSCVSNRGRFWMIALAVASIKQANLRGIVLGGWAELHLDLLVELVGEDDALGLVEYAKKNILFIKKAPQVWLFPKCCVVVIHGGVGTLAAAWSSGTPLIICPVWLDQFGNAWLNVLMGAGVSTSSVDECSVEELAGAMKVAATSKELKRGAEAVQFSMLMDKGLLRATEHIDDILLEEVPSGRWAQWSK